jgi:hypothetical protein
MCLITYFLHGTGPCERSLPLSNGKLYQITLPRLVVAFGFAFENGAKRMDPMPDLVIQSVYFDTNKDDDQWPVNVIVQNNDNYNQKPREMF